MRPSFPTPLVPTLVAGLALGGCFPAGQSLVDSRLATDLDAVQGAEPAPLADDDDGDDLTDPTDPPGPSDDDDASDPVDLGDWTEDTVPRGYVSDPTGLALDGVTVRAGLEIVSITADGGRYEVPSAPAEEPLVLSFQKAGYATTWSSMTPMDGGLNVLNQVMAPVDAVVNFPTWEGTSLTLDDTHTFTAAPNSILDEDGERYMGNVTMSATVFDRETPLDEGGEFLASPGDGLGTTQEGEQSLLYTYGMFQLTLQGEDGETLNPGPGFEIQAEVPEDSNVEDGDPVPFWLLNPAEGTWEQQDSGEIVDIGGGEQTWEFEPTGGLQSDDITQNRTTTWVGPEITGNPDDQAIVSITDETARATGTVKNAQGDPVPGANVRVISDDNTYMNTGRTDENGDFAIAVPPQVPNPVGPNGRDVLVEVDYEAGNEPALWRQDPIAAPPADGEADFGEISLGSMTCVSGTVVDQQGAPVGGMQVTTSKGGVSTSDADGGFCLQVPMWQPSTVYSLPEVNHPRGYEPVRIRPTSDAGTCSTTCENVITLAAYADSTCAAGDATLAGTPASGVRVELFDDRFPGAAVFSTLAVDGAWEMPAPAEHGFSVRIGAGDNAEDNACALERVPAQPAGDACAQVPTLECG